MAGSADCPSEAYYVHVFAYLLLQPMPLLTSRQFFEATEVWSASLSRVRALVCEGPRSCRAAPHPPRSSMLCDAVVARRAFVFGALASLRPRVLSAGEPPAADAQQLEDQLLAALEPGASGQGALPLSCGLRRALSQS